MAELLRAYFLAFYAVAIVVLLVRVLPAASRITAERRAAGARRHLPTVLLPFGFVLPPTAMLLQAGEIHAAWPAVRAVGFALGLYAAAIEPWAAATLGRFLVPQAVVAPEHLLVTGGPYRCVRHPAYSGDLALWLGAALGTLNLALLALFPLYALGVSAQARAEEELLEAKFGVRYRCWASHVGRFVPRLRSYELLRPV